MSQQTQTRPQLFRFTCPHCGYQSLVKQEELGQRGPCAGCGRPIEIPTQECSTLRAQRSRGVSGAWAAVSLATLAVMVFALGGLWDQGRQWLIQQQRGQVGPSARCQQNLARIAAALQGYRNHHGHWPPAWTKDKQGRPLHSWRVLILPYLGYQDLYDRIRLEEPWDSPHNRQFHQQMPPEFACPAAGAAPGMSSYVVVVGPECVFRGATGSTLPRGADPPETIILVVETALAVPWMKPAELDLQRMDFLINSPFAHSISSYHPNGAYVATVAGTVVFLPDNTHPEVVTQALTTADDGPPSLP